MIWVRTRHLFTYYSFTPTLQEKAIPIFVIPIEILTLTSFFHTEWASLPSEIQAAYETLGYSEEVWNSDGEVESNKSDFADLSEEQQAAALAIGYTAESWDSEE